MVTMPGPFARSAAIANSLIDNLLRHPCHGGSHSILCAELAFPGDHDLPALHLELASDPEIALDIPREFLFPELGIGFWGRRDTAIAMSMPKASMHEDNRAMSGKDDVRPARQTRTSQPIP